MGLPKLIPRGVFQAVASCLLLGAVGLAIYWAATSSGVYADIAEGIADDEGYYDVALCFMFTAITLIIPLMPVIVVLRLLSKMPTLREQLTGDPWLNKLGGQTPAPVGASSPAVISAAVQCLPLAPVWARVLVFAVDRLMVLVALLAAAVPTFYAREQLGGPWQIAALGLFLVVLTMAVAYAYGRDAVGGQSLGRRLLGQQVVFADTGEPIGPVASFKRELVLHLLLPVELILLVMDPRRQRLGDSWARTVVVKIDR
jgi:uncharacterized RDD family membrane protein YckC